MQIKQNIANFITGIRLIGAIALIFIKPLTVLFFIVYSFCGLSDAIDGFVARKLKITSKFGSKLDSVSDLTFYTVMMIKLIPKLCKSLFLFNWILLFVVLGIRIAAYVVSAIKFHQFSSLHTILNKITGGGVFLIPYFILLPKIGFNIYGLIVCLIAFAASLQELIYHIKRKE